MIYEHHRWKRQEIWYSYWKLADIVIDVLNNLNPVFFHCRHCSVDLKKLLSTGTDSCNEPNSEYPSVWRIIFLTKVGYFFLKKTKICAFKFITWKKEKYTYNKLYNPRSPIPLKSVLGSSPWKPISHHCLEIRASKGESGFKHFHSFESKRKSQVYYNTGLVCNDFFFKKSVLVGFAFIVMCGVEGSWGNVPTKNQQGFLLDTTYISNMAPGKSDFL